MEDLETGGSVGMGRLDLVEQVLEILGCGIEPGDHVQVWKGVRPMDVQELRTIDNDHILRDPEEVPLGSLQCVFWRHWKTSASS